MELSAMKEPHADSATVRGGRVEASLSSRLRQLVRRYLRLLVVCAIAGIVAGAVANTVAHKTYTSDAQIELTEDQSSQFRLESGVASGLGNLGPSQIDTEIAIIRSTRLALETIRALHLEDNPKFLPPPPDRKWDLSRTADRQALVARFYGGVNVGRVGRTTILDIAVTSSDPDLSATICNQLISTYKTNNFEDNFTATQEVTKWLSNQLSGLRANLETEEAQLVTLQKAIGVVGLDQNQTVLLSRLSGLNGALTTAETARLIQEARVTALRSAGPGVLDALANDPILGQLDIRAAELQTELAAASSTYGSANPRLVTIRSQLQELKTAIAAEQKVALTRAEKELNADIQNENSLQQHLQAAKTLAYSGNADVINYTLAKQQYEGDRTLYEGLQQRLQEAGIIAGLHSSNVRIVAVAEASLHPSSPRRRFNLVIGLLSGIILAAACMFVFELLDTKLHSVQDLENSSGLPVLGIIPYVKPELLIPSAFIPAAASDTGHGWSQIAEAYRSLRSALLLSKAGGPPQVILVTSSRPSEGKTSVTSLTSIILALRGSRVLLIDADMRRPTIHNRFSLSNKAGLSSVLSSNASLEETVQRLPELPTLDILTSGPIPPMPSELLASTVVVKLLQEARAKYDFIFLDTPPILTVTDASALFPYTDGCMLVARADLATRKNVEYAVDLMARLGAPLMGAVFNYLDTKAADYSDYYSAGYGYYTAKKE